MTATADYGVSIVEDFKPPKAMTPGQTVNKDVSVVNTGSVDAFVRTSIVNTMTEMSRINTSDLNTDETSGKSYFKMPDGTTSAGTNMPLTTPADPWNASTNPYKSADTPDGATPLYDLRVFGDTAATVPATAIQLNPMETFDNDGNKIANEVSTLMAGGHIVIQASTAVAPNEQAVRSGDDVNGGFTIVYKENNHADKYYVYHDDADDSKDGYYEVTQDKDGIFNQMAADKTVLTSADISVAALARDYSGTGEYKPTNNGLYIFKRTEAGDDSIYSGFYYKDGTFYALCTEEADKLGDKDTAKLKNITVTYDTVNSDVVKSISGVKFLTEDVATPGTWTVKFGSSETDDSWTDTPTGTNSSDKYLKATYHVTADGVTTTRDVVFFIKLDDAWQTNWTYVADTVNDGIGYFYYNTKLNSGETSTKLVDSVKLADTMTRNNYSKLTYDLKVALDSAQVTRNEVGGETAEALAGWDVKATLNKGTDGVIDDITWATGATYNVDGTAVTVADYTDAGALKNDGYKYKVTLDGSEGIGSTGTYVSKTKTGTYTKTASADALETGTGITIEVTKDADT